MHGKRESKQLLLHQLLNVIAQNITVSCGFVIYVNARTLKVKN